MKKLLFLIFFPVFVYSGTTTNSLVSTYNNCTCPYANQQWITYDYTVLGGAWNNATYQCNTAGLRSSDIMTPDSRTIISQQCVTPPTCTGDDVLEKITLQDGTEEFQCVPPPPPACELPKVIKDINGTEVCDYPWDTNTTNPDGTCKPDYAKDKTGICKPDRDNDNVPDIEDDYPTDPTRSDDGSDGGGDASEGGCTDICGIDNYQDCADVPRPFADRSQPAAEVWYIDCKSCLKTADTYYGMTCAEFEGRQNEVTEPDIDNCDYPSSLLGFSFQSITPDNTACTVLIRSNAQDGKGFKYALPNCSQGGTACYYNPKVAEPEITDSNTSDSVDDTAIVSKLDEVKNSINDLNLPLNNIDDSVKNNTQVLKASLDDNFNSLKTVNSKGFGDVERAVSEGSRDVGLKIDGMNDNIGTKLNALTDAVNSKEEYPMESEAVMQIDETEATSSLNGYKDGIVGEFEQKITDAFSDDLFTLFSISIPTVGSCGCTNPTINLDLSFTSASTTPDLCGTLDSFFSIVRPLLWFVFLVGTLIFFFRRG